MAAPVIDVQGVRIARVPTLGPARGFILAQMKAGLAGALAEVNAAAVAEGEPYYALPVPPDPEGYRRGFARNLLLAQVWPTLEIVTMNLHVERASQFPGASVWQGDIELHLWAKAGANDPDGEVLGDQLERYGAAMWLVLSRLDTLPGRVRLLHQDFDIGLTEPDETVDVRGVGLRVTAQFET